MKNNTDWLDEINFTTDGLVPAIAQEEGTNRILMMAWMNRQSLEETRATGRVVYWSRSRKTLWRKGEQSGHEQHLVEIELDCDADVIILRVRQAGDIACHTGRHSCFYRRLTDEGWVESEPVLKDPAQIYGN